MNDLISKLINTIPLEIFVMVGSFVEEIFAPIPSPLIMTTAGIAASTQKYTVVGIMFLAIMGAIGKTVASYLFYVLADKGEDYFLPRFGKYLGLDHQRLEKVGKMISRGWWDDFVMLFLRAFPIIPTFLVSIACGLLKTDIKSFLITTFVGTFFRNLIFLYIGVVGSSQIGELELNLENNSLAITMGIVGFFIGIYIAIKIKNYLTKKYID